MKHIGLFEGIGGFSLAARWMGWETIAWCEWNDFGQKVLKHHFPKANAHGDITKTDFTIYAGQCDIVTGGFPCQPYSQAGKRLGKEDDRHLWPQMCRAIREIQPSWVVGENVRGLTNWNGGMVFDEVQADLEAEGYEVLPFLLPACAVNAPHRRDRIWFVAYSESNDNRKQRGTNNTGGENECRRETEIWAEPSRYGESGITTNPYNPRAGNNTGTDGNGQKENEGREGQPQFKYRQDGSDGDAADTDSKRIKKCYVSGKSRSSSQFNRGNNANGNYWHNFPTQSPICGGDDGLPDRLDSITFSKWRNESIKAYGNAIVPQVAHQIFKAIEQYTKAPVETEAAPLN